MDIILSTTEGRKQSACSLNIEESSEMHPGQIQVSRDKKTLWVHAMDGSTVGRFSKVFGIDVHATVSAQMDGAAQCIYCTHTAPAEADWLNFCELMEKHHSIRVDTGLIQFN